jgi:hypothetical protein
MLRERLDAFPITASCQALKEGGCDLPGLGFDNLKLTSKRVL